MRHTALAILALAGLALSSTGCHSWSRESERSSYISHPEMSQPESRDTMTMKDHDKSEMKNMRQAQRGEKLSMEECSRLTEGWNEKHKQAVKMMTAKYGAPSEGTVDCIVWKNAAPYKCIKCFREEVPHAFPADHPDFLEHTIAYRIPAEKVSDLTACDGSLYVDRTGGLLSAKCDSEAHNILGFNIANDIFTGKKTTAQGREAYTQAVMDEKKGKSNPYLEKLLFEPASSDARDPDMGTAK